MFDINILILAEMHANWKRIIRKEAYVCEKRNKKERFNYKAPMDYKSFLKNKKG